MKTVKLIDRGAYKAKDALAQVLGTAGAQGITLAQMRERLKLIDAIEAASGGTLTLEDAPFALFKATVEAFPFGTASADLFAVIDAAITPIEPAKAGA